MQITFEGDSHKLILMVTLNSILEEEYENYDVFQNLQHLLDDLLSFARIAVKVNDEIISPESDVYKAVMTYPEPDPEDDYSKKAGLN